MPTQFTVPQFIDAEDRIIGPITLRQFIIMIVAFLTDALLWQLISSLLWFLVAGIPTFVAFAIVAFMPINGQPFHYFILNLIQTFRKPQLRVWDKRLSDAQLRDYIGRKEAPLPPPALRKASPGQSRLKELSLLVNTGGAYNPET